MAVKDSIIFDPSKEELAIADVVLAVALSEKSVPSSDMDIDSESRKRNLRLLAVRTIDPPSRLTHRGVANKANTATGGTAKKGNLEEGNGVGEEGVWCPPRGGAKRKLIKEMIGKVLEKGGVGEEVLDGMHGAESM